MAGDKDLPEPQILDCLDGLKAQQAHGLEPIVRLPEPGRLQLPAQSLPLVPQPAAPGFRAFEDSHQLGRVVFIDGLSVP